MPEIPYFEGVSSRWDSFETVMARTKPLLTPKELADAIGASESSLRRWVDTGRIKMSRTTGGHRRIPFQEAIRFIRQTGATLVRPEVLGFEKDVAGHRSEDGGSSDEQGLFNALLSGERLTAKGLMISWYLEGRELTALLDGPVRGAMHRLGELWKHEERGILLEHRATEICMEALLELRALLPAVEENATVALGGAPESDPYLIPSAMAGMVLCEAGYRDINYGGRTPLHLLGEAAVEHDAALVWISITAPPDQRKLRRQIADLAKHLAEKNIMLVLGGRHAGEVFPEGFVNVLIVNSMAELSAFARGIATGSNAAVKPA